MRTERMGSGVLSQRPIEGRIGGERRKVSAELRGLSVAKRAVVAVLRKETS